MRALRWTPRLKERPNTSFQVSRACSASMLQWLAEAVCFEVTLGSVVFVQPSIRPRHVQRSCGDLYPRQFFVAMDTITVIPINTDPDEEGTLTSVDRLPRSCLSPWRSHFHNGGRRLCITEGRRGRRGQIAVSSLVGFTSPIIFAILVTAAIKYRLGVQKIHKWLMLLAMIAIIWPAFFRFRHYFSYYVPYPEVIFALVLPDIMVVISMLWEKITLGRIHPIYLTAGVALIAENVAEACLFDSSGWRVVANWLAHFFL